MKRETLKAIEMARVLVRDEATQKLEWRAARCLAESAQTYTDTHDRALKFEAIACLLEYLERD